MSQKARNHVSENFKYLGEHAIQTSSKVCVALQCAMLGMQDLDLSEYELLTRKFFRDVAVEASCHLCNVYSLILCRVKLVLFKVALSCKQI